MGEKKKHYFSRMLLKIITIIPSLFGVALNCFRLIEEELQLLKRNLFNFIIVCLLIGALITTIWLCFLGLILFYLMSIHLTIFMSLFIVILINVLLLVTSWLALIKIKKNIAFARTGNVIRELIK